MACTASWQSQVSFSERISHALKMQVLVGVLCHVKHANVDLKPAQIL